MPAAQSGAELSAALGLSKGIVRAYPEVGYGTRVDGHGRARECGRHAPSPPDPPNRTRWKISGSQHHRSSSQSASPP
jgi:hypothetical protein